MTKKIKITRLSILIKIFLVIKITKITKTRIIKMIKLTKITHIVKRQRIKIIIKKILAILIKMAILQKHSYQKQMVKKIKKRK